MSREEETSKIESNKKWGQLKLNKLPQELALSRLRQARPILADEPLFSSALSKNSLPSPKPAQKTNEPIHIKTSNISEIKKETCHQKQMVDKQTQINLQPTVDSYIVNTIKLNRLLNNGVTFDQIECFMSRKENKERLKKAARNKKKSCGINSEEELKRVLKEFVSVMCLHSGFESKFKLF